MTVIIKIPLTCTLALEEAYEDVGISLESMHQLPQRRVNYRFLKGGTFIKEERQRELGID